ncbi:hypothetical protein L0O93_05355 [Bacteroides finegoldii]|nr:hypothetical protein [Bacteroides finegoldii]MCG4683794.1 hypothetical protein [Bacteroides finegoldii]
MVKIQKISEIEPCLGFTEFDMLKKYRQSFATSELGRLHFFGIHTANAVCMIEKVEKKKRKAA